MSKHFYWVVHLQFSNNRVIRQSGLYMTPRVWHSRNSQMHYTDVQMFTLIRSASRAPMYPTHTPGSRVFSSIFNDCRHNCNQWGCVAPRMPGIRWVNGPVNPPPPQPALCVVYVVHFVLLTLNVRCWFLIWSQSFFASICLLSSSDSLCQ